MEYWIWPKKTDEAQWRPSSQPDPDDYDEPSRAQSALLAVYLYGRARINNWGNCSRSNSNSYTQTERVLAQFWHSSNTVKREDRPRRKTHANKTNYKANQRPLRHR
jgi:hypothetical protein